MFSGLGFSGLPKDPGFSSLVKCLGCLGSLGVEGSLEGTLEGTLKGSLRLGLQMKR